MVILKEKIVNEAFNSRAGARQLRREIRRLVENPISNKILENQVKSGDKFTVSLNECENIIFV